MTTQFIIGQTYKINAVEFITVSRRTEVSVWFFQNGKEIRRKIQISGYGENSQEFVNFQDRSLYAIKTTVTVETTSEPTQDTIKTTITPTETVSETTVTPNEVPQDTTKATVNPLPQDEYEIKREKLINRWDKLGQHLGQEKADKYRYTQACKIQGIEADTTSFDETIAEYRQWIKNLQQKINELDIAQGFEPEEF